MNANSQALWERKEWDKSIAFNLWEHYASIGGEDKNRMISISSWLLGGSGTIFWLEANNLILSSGKNNINLILMGLLGIIISILAGYVVLLYGGYSNKNWEQADKIAKLCGWGDYLVPNFKAEEEKAKDLEFSPKNYLSDTKLVLKATISLARARDPKEEFAPVFMTFYKMSRVSASVHFLFICLQMYLLYKA